MICPGSRISNWHYVYILQSLKDKGLYVGYTKELATRIKQHNAKSNFSTKSRTPFVYIYVESCRDKRDAMRREEYLKTTQGGRFLKIRLKEFFGNNKVEKLV
jgi:putative endonuclease